MKHNNKYPERESRILEFKEVSPDYKKLAKTVIAFANGIGGTVIFGIEDKTRRVLGVKANLIDKYFEEIPRAIFQLVTPHLMIYPFEKNYNGFSLFGVNVYPGDNKPYYLTPEGKLKGIYVRVGSHTMRANSQFIEELNLQSENRSYDELLIHNQTINRLDRKLMEEQFGCKFSEHHLESNRIAGRDHITGEFVPTVGGIIMFHPKPSDVISEAYISCTKMKGESGRDTIETHDFEGPLPIIAQSAINQVESWLERNLKLKGSKLKGEILIPHEALREGIYNAVLHRKYNVPGAVKITMWSNRLEIFSPGHFVGLMNRANLGDGTTYIRNRVICAIARKIRLMEKRGTGIRLIIDSCRASGNVSPIFEEGADWVKLTFNFSLNVQQKVRTTDVIFKELLARNDKITNRDVVKACDVSREKANLLIKQEIEKGILVRDGNGRSTKYLVQRQE